LLTKDHCASSGALAEGLAALQVLKALDMARGQLEAVLQSILSAHGGTQVCTRQAHPCWYCAYDSDAWLAELSFSAGTIPRAIPGLRILHLSCNKLEGYEQYALRGYIHS
jgi:hypothetical protein